MTETTLDIQAAIDSGDPALIAQAMAQVQIVQSDPYAETSAKPAEKAAAVEEKSEIKSEPQANTEIAGETGAAPGTTEEPYVEAKDGLHKIPYRVYEKTRAKANEADRLARENAELKAQLSAKDGGEEADRMSELDPELGAEFKTIKSDVSAIRSQQVTPEQIEVMVAIKTNPDLKVWQRSDPDRWQLAVEIDDELQKDPDYANKSIDERFEEVARLVKVEFGDVSPQQKNNAAETLSRAAQIVAEREKAGVPLPKTLTDVGAPPATGQRSQAEILLEKSPEEIAEAMMNMSSAQKAQLLAGIVIVE